MDPRINKEKDFHNKRFDNDIRDHLDKYYSVTGASRKLYQEKVFDISKGDKILEYGCGLGSSAFELAKSDCNVYGIDISDVAIEKARLYAKKNNLNNMIFQVMNAEELEFENDFFNEVCGTAILHHLILEKALSELSRVLKVDGKAIFLEPLGHNVLINFYRKITPSLRTEDEHPLVKNDLNMFSRYFKDINIYYFHLSSLMAVPFRNFPFFNGLLKALDKTDQLLFKLDPLKFQAWQVVIELSGPKK